MTNRFLQKYPVLFCLLILILIMPQLYFLNSQNPYVIGQTGYYSYTALTEFSAAFITIIIMYKVNLTSCMQQSFKSFINGIILGSTMLIYCFGSLIIGFSNYKINNMIIPNFASIYCIFLMMFSVGFFEELLCRGILLNTFLIKWAGNKKGIYIAVLLSSTIFGSLHFINLLVRPTLLFFTISQVLYTTMAGTFFATIYLRSRNLWPSILYHSLHDICTGIFYILLPAEKLTSLNVHYAASSDQSIGAGIFLILVTIPLFIISFFLLKKVDSTQSQINTLL